MGCNQGVVCQLWLFESYFHIAVSRLYVCVSFVVPFQLRRWFQLVLAPGFYEKIKRAVFVPFPVPKKKKGTRKRAKLGLISSFATVFLSFERILVCG